MTQHGYMPARYTWDSGAGPLGVLIGADDVLAWNGTDYVPKQRTIKRQGVTNQASVLTTYADITQLNVTINRAGVYIFDYWIRYQTSGAGEGIGLQLAFTGVAATIDYSIDMFTDPATRAPLITANTFASGIAPQATGPGAVDAIARITGSFNTGNVGVLSCQLRASTGGANSVNVRISSWGMVVAL